MASVIYQAVKFLKGTGSLTWTSDTIRTALVMTNTTVDTEDSGIDFLADFADLDEFDGAGYSRLDLGTKAFARDDPNSRTEFDAADAAYGALAAGSRDVQGVLIFKFVTTDADSVPLAFVEFAAPVTADGTAFTIQWDAEGIVQEL
jgi:hypothetical protein